MVNIPKQKGTSAETAVVSFLRSNGFPHAERRSLKGAQDWGDVTGIPGIAWEVKYANGGIRMAEWMSQTQVEKTNAKATHGILVIKPKGLGDRRTGEWPAVMLLPDYDLLQDAAEMAVAHDGLDITVFHMSPPSAYNQDHLLEQVAFETRRSIFNCGQIRTYASVFQPRGTKEDEGQWLAAVPLANITVLLRLAGYGTPINFEEVFNGPPTPAPQDSSRRLDEPEPALD